MISTIQQSCQDYYNDLPRNILPTIAQSACYTFAIHIFINLLQAPLERSWQSTSINVARPLLNAGIAALACAIYACVTPLFNGIFGVSKTSDFHLEMTKDVIVSFAVSILMNYCLFPSAQLNSLKFIHCLSLNTLITAVFFVNQKFQNFLLRRQNTTYPPLVNNSVFLCLDSIRFV